MHGAFTGNFLPVRDEGFLCLLKGCTLYSERGDPKTINQAKFSLFRAEIHLPYDCEFKRLSCTEQIKLPLTMAGKWPSKTKLIFKSLEKAYHILLCFKA